MSYTAIAVTVSLFVSLCPLLLLARHDPKRLRTIRKKELKPHGRRTRQFYSTIALLPGAFLIAQGNWPAFLIWFGVLIACAWVLVQILAEPASPSPTPSPIKKPR